MGLGNTGVTVRFRVDKREKKVELFGRWAEIKTQDNNKDLTEFSAL